MLEGGEQVNLSDLYPAPPSGDTPARADFSPEISQDGDWFTYMLVADPNTKGEVTRRIVVVPVEQVQPGMWRLFIDGEGWLALNSTQVYRTRGAALGAAMKDSGISGCEA